MNISVPKSAVAPANRSGNPLVSVIMNCLNREKYLREAIDSVYAQSYQNWEIIFWDNASTDRSADIAQSFRDGRLRYFHGETTVPLGHARNLAIQQSMGELVAFLDCDDLWLPPKLEKQVPLFLADDTVGLVYSDSYFFNASGMQKRLYAQRRPYRGHRFAELLNNYVISLETAVIRKPALISLDHWFNVDFSAIEEYDLFVRIGLDWKIDFVPEVLAKWRVHGESLTWRAPDLFIQEKRVMLENLQRIPKVRTLYGGALAWAWQAHALAEAKMLWKRGDGPAARRKIGRPSIRSMKSMLFWGATFFPCAVVESTRNALTRAISPSAS